MFSLFIGRFQPFHFGHLSVIKKALKTDPYLIIAIGSAEDSFQKDNPFTTGERFQMIKNSLDAEKINPQKYTIIPIRNINNFSIWVSHVENLTPPFSKIYTGSPLVKELFLRYSQKYQIIDIKKELKINATQIRNLILEDKNWQKFVHAEVAKVIKNCDGVERIKKIHDSLPFS